MNILEVVQRFPPAWGGSEKYFRKLAHFLASRGHQVSVWTSNALDLEAFWSGGGKTLPAGISSDSGVTLTRFPLMRLPLQRQILRVLSRIPIRSWQALCFGHNPILPDLWKACHSSPQSFDLVHAGCFPYSFPIACALQLARRLKVPFLVTPFLHLGDLEKPDNRVRRGYTHPALRQLLLQADGIFVQTGAEFDAVKNMGIPPTKIHLQGMGVELEDCTSGDAARGKTKWSRPGVPIIGHLANLSWDKGSTDLLEACAKLWQQGKDFQLLLAGPSMPSFEKVWAHFPFQEKVTRTGPLSDSEKKDFFACIDLFALPSRSDSFGIVLLEAWANSKPVVVYNAGGPGSLVHQQEDGLIIPCDNIHGLSEALACLLKDESLREKLGTCGFLRIHQEFQWESKLCLFEKVATQVCKLI